MTALLRRELLLSLRHGADTLAAVLFFLLAGALFPLALGPSPELLRRMAPGVVWVCALLAALLPLDRMFGSELEDGSLDQLMLSGLPASARHARTSTSSRRPRRSPSRRSTPTCTSSGSPRSRPVT